MKDNIRLRLVVRRHNLPEVRVLFSIPLREEPTIADLLAQVNDTIPLESPDWGLDDYAVEVEDSQGQAFECLHFQSVAAILDRDEQVIIRPLFMVDRKKRLLSGRDQIASDGKHLLDGVPFGRPRLRAPRGRPPVDIPPLKRRRIAFDVEDGEGLDLDDDDDEDDEYQEDGAEGGDESPLMLTEFGEEDGEPGAVRVAAVFDDADDAADQDPEADGGDGDEELDEEENFDDFDEDDDEDQIDEAELLDELRDIQMDNELLGDESLHRETDQVQPEPTNSGADSDLARLNKITALRRAFPAGDCHLYQDILQSHNWSEEEAYRELRRSYEASMTLDQMRDLLASFSLPVLPSTNTVDAGAQDRDEAGAESDAGSTNSVVKRYDEHGFPSGSILDGSASRVAAEALRKAGHAVRSPVLTRFDDDGAGSPKPKRKQLLRPRRKLSEVTDEGDSSSSSSSDSDEDDGTEKRDNRTNGESQSESESDSDSDGDSSDYSSSGEDDPSDAGGSDDSSDADGSDESEDSDGDSGPEVLSAKPPAEKTSPHTADQPKTATDSSPSKQRKRGPAATDATSGEDSSGSEDSSDNSSESDDSSSDESSDDGAVQDQDRSLGPAASPPKPAPTTANAASNQPQAITAAKETPPGQGLTRTQLRNRRRKLALQARRAAAAAGNDAHTTPTPNSPALTAPVVAPPAKAPIEVASTDDLEIELRRKALMQILMAGAAAAAEAAEAEAAAQPDTIFDVAMDGTELRSTRATPGEPSATESVTTTTESPSQRRSRLDVGAGRRMLFASLGLRNPKTKADEDKIRGDLMKGVRPLVNHRISEPSVAEKEATVGETPSSEAPDEEDPGAWRSKINYTAVECVQEGVELSEPPFPFVQRWDPQQQFSWKDKRGGKGKRKQRNQTEFYEDDSTQPSAKKQRVNYAENDDVFGDDDPFPADAADGIQEHEVELNYDDIPDASSKRIATDQPSQMTDMDDLPSLPKDLTTLAPLTLEESKPGMVITWKQMILSKATNWAPQVMDLTAVIVSLDEPSEELRVVLARRDRHLDGKEKIFDEEGNRVYDRFEGPDDDNDDDDDDDDDGANEEGFRTIQYSDMTDPRIVQQPLPSLEKTALHTIVESQLDGQADKVMADSDDRLASDGLEKEAAQNDPAEDSTTLSNRQDSARDADEVPPGAGMEGSNEKQDESSYGSVIPDSVPAPDETLDESANAADHPAEIEAGDVSITDDGQHDISAMIREAGFRTDLPPSIANETRFSIEDLSSPSRQLSAEMSEAGVNNAKQQAPELLGQAQPARSASAAQEATLPTFDGAVEEPSSPANGQETPRASTGRDATPTVSYPQLPILPSSASSVRSGRQPDNDVSMDWGDDALLPHSEDLGEGLPLADDSRIETTVDDNNPTPVKSKAPEGRYASSDNSALDSSPLPTLDEIFLTASQARQTQSPVKAKLSAAPVVKSSHTLATAKRDLEYEDMMRRIDDSELGWEDDQAQIKNVLAPSTGDSPPPGAQEPPSSSVVWDEKLGRIKKERWSQSVTAASAEARPKKKKEAVSKPASFRKAVSPPPSSSRAIAAIKKEYASSQASLPPLSQPKRRRTTAGTAQKAEKFVIPEGSEVIALLTSSPEPEVEEHYAEDSIDSTYEDPDGAGADSDMPDGSGWVKKPVASGKSKKKGAADRGRRGVSLSALPARKADAAAAANANGKRPSSSMVGAGGKGVAGKRRKGSARF